MSSAYQEFTDTHANSANEEETATTEALDTVHSWKRHEHIHDVGRDSDQERLVDSRVLEERSTKVEDEAGEENVFEKVIQFRI
jgi:hypothetical protein